MGAWRTYPARISDPISSFRPLSPLGGPACNRDDAPDFLNERIHLPPLLGDPSFEKRPQYGEATVASDRTRLVADRPSASADTFNRRLLSI